MATPYGIAAIADAYIVQDVMMHPGIVQTAAAIPCIVSAPSTAIVPEMTIQDILSVLVVAKTMMVPISGSARTAVVFIVKTAILTLETAPPAMEVG